jgi:magnesium-protoporphyrin IX monomethyl ester (oxidative) cyclase
MGGYYPTFNYKEIIHNYSSIDAVVRGEGEEVIIKLCDDYFTNGRFTVPLDGVSYKDINGSMVLSDHINHIQDLDSLPFPSRDNMEIYAGNGDIIVSMEASRGCPYGCSFCSITVYRKNAGIRSAKSISDEIISIFNQHRDYKDNMLINFIDNLFYADPQLTREVIARVKVHLGHNFKFAILTHVKHILKGGLDSLRFLKSAGCIGIEFGVENGSDSVLKRYNKGITASQSIEAINMVRDAGIQYWIDFILYDPYTTIDELKENLQFFKDAGLWGYDEMALLYSRVSMLPYSLKNPANFIPPDEYFIHKDICEIFKIMNSFQKTYQYVTHRHFPFWEKPDVLNIPFDLFEALLTDHDNPHEIYKRFIRDHNVDERILIMK